MSERKKRFLFFIQSTVPSNSGAGLSAFNYAIKLHQQGVECTILCYDFSISRIKKEVVEGIIIVRLPLRNSVYQKLISIVLASWVFFNQLKKADHVLIYGIPTGRELFLYMVQWLGKDLIFRSTLMHNDDLKSIQANRALTYRLLVKNLNLYWAINPHFAALHNELGLDEDKVLVNSQGVNIDKFRPARDTQEKNDLRKTLGLPVDQKLVISIGYVIERKGYRAVFDALENCQEDLLYLVVGDYSLEEGHYLHPLSDEMNALYQYGNEKLGKKVRFLGARTDVAELLRASDIFVLNSESEGVPNALLEAMATGLVCVSTSLEGVDGFLTKSGENTIVLHNEPEKAREEIQEAISGLRQNSEMAVNARKTIVDGFSVEASVNKLLARL